MVLPQRQTIKSPRSYIRGDSSGHWVVNWHRVTIRCLIALGIISIYMNVKFLFPASDGKISAAVSSAGAYVLPFPNLSAAEGREHILSVFKEAGVELDAETIAKLPTWEEVQSVVGNGPHIYGLDKCPAFRETVPAVERMLGSSGMFNTGTNLVTHLLKQNCQIPERLAKYGPKATREEWGMRWQVPWGKHTPAKYRLAHATAKAVKIHKEWILPVVTIRHPYTWFRSMCKSAYTARWDHGKVNNCPNIVSKDGDNFNALTVRYADDRQDEHDSIAHLWNDWYAQYYKDADYPFIMIRMEDLVFYAKETTTAICECAGGKIRTDQPFKYVVDSAKADSRGHDTSTGIVEAWIKYSRILEAKGGFSDSDYAASKQVLNQELMNIFGYAHPPES